MNPPVPHCITPYFELLPADGALVLRRTDRPFASTAELAAAVDRILGLLALVPRPPRMLVDLRHKSSSSDLGFEPRLAERRRELVTMADRVAIVTDLGYVRDSLTQAIADGPERLALFEDEAQAQAWLTGSAHVAA